MQLVEQFVGFYWTLPIYWADFREFPRGCDVEAAAAKSRTIRYQMHVVRRWVADQKGKLIKEIFFMEASPDRGTEAVKSELLAVSRLCQPGQAILLYVNFSEETNWRRHPHLLSYLQEHNIRPIELSPDVAMINGERFDPINHFKESRRKHQLKTASLRETATTELLAAAQRQLHTGGTYQSIGDELNDRGVKTPTGKLWTEEIVRKTLKRRGASLGKAP